MQEVNPARTLQHSPLFQTAVVFHNAPDVASVRLTGGGAVYQFTLSAVQRGTTIGGSYEYRTDLYDAATVQRIASHVDNVLAAAARDDRLRISELPLLGAEERQLLTATFNDTRVALDPATLVEQIRGMVLARPEAIAVIASDGALTYQELDRRSSAIAARLRARGAQSGTFVALVTDRTSALLVAALGILKSGAAYLPVDLTYPAARIALMLRDSGARLAVTTRATRARLDVDADLHSDRRGSGRRRRSLRRDDGRRRWGWADAGRYCVPDLYVRIDGDAEGRARAALSGQ